MRLFGNLQTGGLKVDTQISYTGVIDNGNSGASKNIDWTTGNRQKITLTGSPGCSITFTAPTSPSNLMLIVVQGSGGSKTITWPTIKWVGKAAPTLTTTSSAEDIIAFFYDGSSYYGMFNLNFGTP